MHVKIQGGGDGKYANRESCAALVNYLQHEDKERLEKGKIKENFFSHFQDKIDAESIINSIDNNRKKLCKNDAKFFVLTVSLSEKEIQHLGKKEELQSEKIKRFIRNDVMENYAKNFNKGLKAEDLMYFAKIHFDRKKDSKNQFNTHCHIIVSRKTMNGKIRISPKTNHINTKDGAIKGGFSRTDFYKNVEKSFDKRIVYPRKFQETIEFNNGIKKGSPNEVKELTLKSFSYNEESEMQLKAIDETCKNLSFTEETRSNLFKGDVYTISGEFNSKEFGGRFSMNEEQVYITKQNEKFELMVGNETFKSWLGIVSEISNNQEQENDVSQHHKRRKR